MQAAPRQGSIEPIERKPLHELVAGRVRDMIIEGHLMPGAHVNESRLCAELGVSRTPMREAIRMLAGEGLILLRPGRSTQVRSFTTDEVRDMLDVIAELEALAGHKVCAAATEAQISDILDTHGRMLDHYVAGERLTYYKLNQQIHSMIVEASGSTTLAEFHGLLQSRMKRIRFVGNSAPEKWCSAVREHEEMIEALRIRNGDALAEVLRRHIRNTFDRVVGSI